MTKKGKKKEPKKKGKKYQLQLSEYGTVAHRGDVIVEANSEEEAVILAEKMAENDEIEFDNDNGALDGWEYQVENVEEVKA